MFLKSKRIMTAFLAVVMLLCSFVPITASAAEVTMDLSKAEVSWDYTLTDADGNAFSAAYGLTAANNPFGYAMNAFVRKMHDYTAKVPGLSGNKSDWVYGRDYVYCFCIEHGIPLPDSGNYSGSSNSTHGNKYEMLSDKQKELLYLALAYGYPNRTDLETSKDANACYSATQLIVWQITMGFRSSVTELNDKTYPMAGYSGTMTEQYTANKYLKKYYDLILSDMASHYKRPSFAAAVPSASKTYEMEYKNGKYTLTLTDTNNVLSKFYVSASGGVSASISGNKLTLTSSAPINTATTLKLTRRMPSTSSTTGFLIWSVAGKENANQDMVSGVPADNDPVPAYLKLMTAAGSIKIVKASEDGIVDGISFRVQGNGIDQTVTTKNGGQIQVDNLRPGTYTVTENAASHYEPQNAKTVTVISGQTATVNFSNILKRGDLTVTKTSEDGLTEGMTFQLSGTSDAGYAVNEFASVGKDGKAYFNDILIGKNYVLQEVNTPTRYVIPESQTADILWNKVTEKSFNNILKKWRVDMIKRDGELSGKSAGDSYGQPQGDAILEGAVYGAYKDGVLLDTYTTDKNGHLITDYYPCYDNVEWTIREVSPSEGYLLDPTVYHVDTNAGKYTIELNTEYLNVTEDIIKGKISIIKHTDDGSTMIETPEEGAVFEVFLKSAGTYENAKVTERDLLRCDEFGFAETVDLPYGVYVVKQIKGWEGRELLPAFDVNVSEDGKVYRYLINNANFESYLHVVKTDATTGKTIPYAGAGFQIFSPEGKLVTMTYTYPELTVIDTFYTNEDGTLLTPEKLPYGKGYSLVEVQAPHGYVLDKTPLYFDVTAEDSVNDDGITIIKVEKENEPQKGTISVIKTGELFSSVVKTKDGYQPVYEEKGLAGAVYEITAAEDIITPDGTLRYTKGQTVATITTDENGKATSDPLFLGRFTVREITAPYGMTISNETVTVELTYAGQEIAITTTETSFVNERQKAKIDLDKVMEQDETFGIGNNGEILSVVFGIYAAEDIKAADGSIIPKDELIESVKCNENGSVVFATDLPIGAKLYVKEIQTDSHYILSDEVYPVNFEYAGQTVAVVEITVNDGDSIHNEIIRGNIIGKKLDEDGNTIIGALFGLFRENETGFTEDTAIQVAESGEDGVFSFEDVPYGRWIVREIKAAPAYVLNENNYAVTVNKDGEIIEITIENEFITGSVTTTKVDKEFPDNKLTGAVFEIYLDADGDGKYTAEADTLVGEMTELDSGVYAMHDLRYGGYFLYEKTAPEGFLKDEEYHYFEIRNDGETVIVENEAGVGFTNKPITGELELTKTDIADGKPLAKVGFRIRNDAGEIVAEGYTDENGIANFKLRYGKYTYEEFVALDGYIPDEKAYPFEIRKDGEIVKAAITNKRIPTPDNPQTGDDSNLGFWIGLGAVALGGLVAAVIIGIKRKKDDEE